MFLSKDNAGIKLKRRTRQEERERTVKPNQGRKIHFQLQGLSLIGKGGGEPIPYANAYIHTYIYSYLA
jgi:hypothetical protein